MLIKPPGESSYNVISIDMQSLGHEIRINF